MNKIWKLFKTTSLLVATALLISACGGGASADQGAQGPAGLSVISVVDRITSPAGMSVTNVIESHLTALPPGYTTRRVMVLNAVLRSGSSEALPILGVFHAFIAPNPVSGAYPVTVWDPASGTEFPGSGLDVVHLYIVSFFTN